MSDEWIVTGTSQELARLYADYEIAHKRIGEQTARISELERELAEARATVTSAMADAAVGGVVWHFIDRMNDYCPVDPAEKILDEFTTAVRPAIDAAITAARALPVKP